MNWKASYEQACDDADTYKAEAERRIAKLEQNWRSCQHEIDYLRALVKQYKVAPAPPAGETLEQTAHFIVDALADRWDVDRCSTDVADDAACVLSLMRAPAGETARELADIQDRAEACEQYYMSPLGEVVIKRDVPRLLAEIKRLSAAREGLAALVERMKAQPVPPTIATDDAFRDIYCQGYRHALNDVADALAAWLKERRDA